ncbi:transcriptional regulator [Pigmentiphaga sp. NML080357]|uniref:IclR family transcriptional regulator n=1 Tax=Pigmentiphaga sp. NML080357 TaxID=2008675 RepID=UPI000B40D847|nr:IclR family transcriptional regulator [Pigmentiphaga sp. NML080357]OVZ55130.1 transcriptional regulator [Pigmentiphaga sp. NML080357]
MQDSQDGAEGRLSSVASAIRVLKAFSETEVEIGISTLAKRLGLAKSTVHRLASTLAAEGLLEQNTENGRYRLGLGLFALGALVRRRMDISTQALPYLHELREITGETVHLATLEQSNIIYLFNLESHQAIRMRSYVGARKPAFCTSEGRALLAFQGPEILARVLKDGLAARTPQTQTDPAELRKTLEQARREGYAVDDEESEVGMRGLAAPVRDHSGQVIAAIGIAGPVQRLTKKAIRGFIAPVVQTADAVSARLGYQP